MLEFRCLGPDGAVKKLSRRRVERGQNRPILGERRKLHRITAIARAVQGSHGTSLEGNNGCVLLNVRGLKSRCGEIVDLDNQISILDDAPAGLPRESALLVNATMKPALSLDAFNSNVGQSVALRTD
jgi:hypothetical protein